MTAVRGRPGPVSRMARRRAERLLADNIIELTARALDLARLGDPVALKACLDRVWPVQPPTDANSQPARDRT